MFGQSSNQKTQFLKSAQDERLQRQETRQKKMASIKIQACVRMFLCCRRLEKNIREGFDSKFKEFTTNSCYPALSVFTETRKLFIVYKSPTDDHRFLLLCKVIMTSLENGKEPKYWYMSVMLIKEWTSLWLSYTKKMLNLCCNHLKTVKTYILSGNKAASIYLSMLLTFTDCKNWKILKIKGGDNIRPVMQHVCSAILVELIGKGLVISLQNFLFNGLVRSTICLNKISITATTTLLIRALDTKAMNNSSGYLIFVLNTMTVPAYVYHLNILSAEGVKMLTDFEVYKKVLSTLSNYNNMRTVFDSVNANSCLSLIGNLLTLCQININKFEETKEPLKLVLSGLLNHCQSFLGKHSGNSKWHPLLGWYHDSRNERPSNEAYSHVSTQLKYLWKRPLVGTFFENLPSLEDSESMVMTGPDTATTRGGLLRRAFFKSFKKLSTIDLNEPSVLDICMTCDLYQTLTMTVTQMKLEIVVSLSQQEEILVRLWRFIYSLGPGAGMQSILNYINGVTSILPKPLSSLLILFCNCSSQLIPILDDTELYEKHKPFSGADLVKLASFLNVLVFKLIWNSESSASPTTDATGNQGDQVMKSALELLLVLYDRDCRKSFTPPNHWLIRELKVSHFQNELKQNKDRAISVLQNIPHVLPHMERVKIFHNLVDADKRSLGINKDSRASALVTIKRSRLLEDGYEQLSQHTGNRLKGIIRVKFINEQGLDEAGIDQDGVFKEFLEDVISEAFNPNLNLFKMTTGGDEQKLYPSTTSFIHESHLQLFEFIGKILGKALYEGILVDVPFASFFLNTLLQRPHSVLYSSIDELPSLDPEMYKNLNFIKNYDDDVSDLNLVFAYDEDILGQMVTHDLKPGGRAIQVTNSNKLSYIHLMARFRLHTQIKHQSNAFVRGFRSIISPEWLHMFSAPELQWLISGCSEHFDLSDLRANARYYGGYHAGHQTITWLWDILNNEFTLAEKKMFLKFVTSCSNPPLMGFKYLEPPFSIRFVDCSDEEDTGDSVGGIVRGLFNVRKRSSTSSSRLPTASTCFNLLKLPCYKKKNVLREKLKYAIKCGAGFELS